MKARCIEELQKFVAEFTERREKVTDEVLRTFTRPRKLEFAGNPNPTQPLSEQGAAGSEANGSASAPAKVEREDGRGTKGERKAAKLAEKNAAKLALRQKGGEGAEPAA